MAAPANGSHHFRQVAVVKTGPDGIWRTRLRPGPSRIVVAQFGGGSTVEPSVSKAANVVVPAPINLHIHPRSAHWGRTIKISGRVRGGYVPTYGEVVLLWVRWRGGSTEIGHVYTNRDGRFKTTYTFGQGAGAIKYKLWATTGRESDYPYAPGR